MGTRQVEEYIVTYMLDERCARALREESPEVQQAIMLQPLEGARNASAAVMSRMKQIKQGVLFEGPFAQKQGLMQGDVTVDQGVLEQFILENEIDESAARDLMNEAPAIQQAVLQQGSLSGAYNKSSALITRISKAKKGQLKNTQLDFMNKPVDVAELQAKVQKFITDNALDEKAQISLLAEDPQVQQVVLALGSLESASNKSSALMARIGKAKSGVGAMGKPKFNPMNPMMGMMQNMGMGMPGMGMGMGMPTQNIAMAVQRFIQMHDLDENCAQNLLSESSEVQQRVINMARLENTANKNSAIMSLIGKVKKELGIGPGTGSSMISAQTLGQKSPQELAVEIQQLIIENDIDPNAAKSLMGETPEVQEAVLQMGSVAKATNKSSAIMARIGKAKRVLAAGPGATLGNMAGEAGGGMEGMGAQSGMGGMGSMGMMGGMMSAMQSMAQEQQQRNMMQSMGSASSDDGQMNMMNTVMDNMMGEMMEMMGNGMQGGMGDMMKMMGAMMKMQGGQVSAGMGGAMGSGGAMGGGMGGGMNPMMGMMQGMMGQMMGAGAGAAGGKGGGKTMDVHSFVNENQLDMRVAHELLAQPFDVQQKVMASGPLANVSNPSSACMARIRNAKRGGPY